MKIGYADDIFTDYAKALDDAKTLTALRVTTRLFALVAADAVEVADKMNEGDFEDWEVALRKERGGVFMGEALAERFGALLMPETMLRVSMVADQFKVPWGLAYHRLVEAGRVKVKNNVATFLDPQRQGQ